MSSTDTEEFQRKLAFSKHIIVLAGAGLSAASGIPTFRGPNGLWKTNDALRLVTPAAWREDPSRTWRWTNHRREMISKASPNAAHRALALFSLPGVRAHYGLGATGADFTLITQNIDELSTRALDDLVRPHLDTIVAEAGLQNLGATTQEVDEAKGHILAMHGCVWDVVCTNFECQHREKNYDVPICPAFIDGADLAAAAETETVTQTNGTAAAGQAPTTAAQQDRSQSLLEALHASLRASPALRRTGLRPPTPPPPVPLDQLPRCSKCGSLARPGEVWFGEAALHMDEIFKKVEEADLCIVVGTSATIHPAAKFAAAVQEHGGKVAVFNLERTKGDETADFLFLGPCEELLPEALGVSVQTAVLDESEDSIRVYSHTV